MKEIKKDNFSARYANSAVKNASKINLRVRRERRETN